jgi:RNA polymerase sigma-70 factor (ECF subfamily)
MKNESDIISRCIKKDRNAQKILYEHYSHRLMGMCLRYTGNRTEAEDVLQEGFVKIFANISSFEGRSSLYGWMKKVIINTAITLFHRNLKHQHHMDVDDLREKTPDNSDSSDAQFSTEELLEVIASLPPGYRMVFNLYAIEGFKHKEIAKQLEIDVNTSKSQYSRAKKLIQLKLEHLQKEASKRNG